MINWYSFTNAELEKLLRVRLSKGLSNASALARATMSGKAADAAKERIAPLKRLLGCFGEVLSYIPLTLALCVCFLGIFFGEDSGCGIACTVIALFTVIASLLKFFLPVITDKLTGRGNVGEVKVIRHGTLTVVPHDMLVPGDVVVLSDRDIVPCDIRLVSSENLYVMEFFSDNLRRKYRPVAKNAEVITRTDVKLPERLWKNCVFKNSVITSGRGIGVVINPELTLDEAMVILQRPIIEGRESEMLSKTPSMLPFLRRFNLSGMSAKESEAEMLLRDGKFLINNREGLSAVISLFEITAAAVLFAVGVFSGAGVYETFLFASLIMAFPFGTLCDLVGETAFCAGAYEMSKNGVSVKSLQSAEKLCAAESVFCKKKSVYRVKSVSAERVLIGRRSFEASSYYKNELAEIVGCACYASDVKSRKNSGKITYSGEPADFANFELAVKAGISSERGLEKYLVGKSEKRSPDGVLEEVTLKRNGELSIIKGSLKSILPKCTYFDSGNGIVPIDTEACDYLMQAVLSAEADDSHIASAVAVRRTPVPSGSDKKESAVGYTLLGVMIYKVNFCDDSAEPIAECRRLGISPILFTPDISAGIEESARRIGIASYGEKAIEGFELAGMSDDAFFNDIDKYKILAGLSDTQKRAVIAAYRNRSEITAVCTDSLRDIKYAVEGDVVITSGNAAPALKAMADVHCAREGFSSVFFAISGCRKILKSASYAVKYCAAALVSSISALSLCFLGVCAGTFINPYGSLEAAPPISAPLLSLLLFAVIPACTFALTFAKFLPKQLLRHLPKAFIDSAVPVKSFKNAAFISVITACYTLLSMLCAFVFESDSAAAGFAVFITLSLSTVLIAMKSVFVRAITPESNEECVGVPPALAAVFCAEAAFILWLFLAYSPVSFAADFMIFRIGFLTLVLSCVCALLIPIFSEIRNSLVGVVSIEKEIERIDAESKTAGEKKIIAKSRRVTESDEVKTTARTSHEGKANAGTEPVTAPHDIPLDEKHEEPKHETKPEPVKTATEKPQTDVTQSEAEKEAPPIEAPKTVKADIPKTSEKDAKRKLKLRKKIEKHRKKDIDDGWDVI